MKVARWGNSLAVRLPASLVETLDLKEGDDVEIGVGTVRRFNIAKGLTKEEASRLLRSRRGMIPTDFKFGRDDANER